jgi:hypothetical protein
METTETPRPPDGHLSVSGERPPRNAWNFRVQALYAFNVFGE